MKASWFAAALLPFLSLFQPAIADPPKKDAVSVPPVFSKLLPESLEDLKAIQAQTKKVLEKVVPCTVGVQIGGASGSGVIVSKDGYILTAGHVSGKPGQVCTIILSDGKRIKGKSLGHSESDIDAGMFQITDKGEWPFAEIGKSADLKRGQWCIAVGHPNGYVRGRSPVVRLGRILRLNKTSLDTDCTLVGGDSGGPLFDLEGKVIGIHSRIGTSINGNTHVPADVYTEKWDRMVAGDDYGPPSVRLGVIRDESAKECKLSSVSEGSPAEKAGLKAGDIITKFDGKVVKTYDDLLAILGKKKPDDEVEVLVKRGEESTNLKVKLGKR